VGVTASVKVTIVCAPAITVTVAVPAAKLLAVSSPALGNVETAVIKVPLGTVSVISTWPAGSVSGVPHVPALGGPAATVTGVPATLNVKFVPTVTPLPAILQICRKPVVGGGGIVFTKVATVWPPGSTATVAVPAAKSLLINNPAPGRVLTEAKAVPDGIVSVISVGMASTVSAALQDPPGAGPAATVTGVPAMLNEKFVPLKIDGNQTLWLVQALGIQRYPSTVIAGSDGTIRANHTGYVDAIQLSADLRRVLEETPAVAQAQTP